MMGHEFDGQDPYLPPGVTQDMIDRQWMSEEEMEQQEIERLKLCGSIETKNDIVVKAGTHIVVLNPTTGEYLPVVDVIPMFNDRPRILTIVVDHP